MFDKLHCLRFVLCFATLLFPATANHWDIAVTLGKHVEFLSQNGSSINRIEIPEAVSLSALTYDDTSNSMILGDTDANRNGLIFRVNLNDSQELSRSLLTQQNKSHISAMAFHAKSKTLFWADTLNESVMKMKIPSNEETANPVVLHRLPQQSPRAVAIDVCNSHIYWTNSNTANASIERSHLDGTNHETILNTDLYEPIGIAVDNKYQKLYWVDDTEGIHFKIERSNLDGTNRETVFKGKNRQPVFLALNDENIYWTDWTSVSVLMLSKNSLHGQPKILQSYESEDVRSMNVIVNQSITTCEDLHMIPDLNVEKKSHINELDEKIPYEITFPVAGDSNRKSEICSNNGHFNKIHNICHCEPGFTGLKCEISMCHNYCLEGKCVIANNGLPQCQCKDGYEGTRCERNKCNGYCLNGAECFIENGQPNCKCKYVNTTRCERNGANYIEFLTLFCMSEQFNNLNKTHKEVCRCIEKEQVLQQIFGFDDILDYNIIVPFLGVLIVVLIIVVTLLSIYVHKLNRKPRIKRRYVVNRSGVTPLTSRPQLSGEQCEITIENCCNMNICETPCFEPKLRNTIPATLKKDEKNSLLDNMENNIF